jgi:hypothetical protein
MRGALARITVRPGHVGGLTPVVSFFVADETIRRPCRPIAFLPLRSMSKKPSRIELLELDIDLRLADLWREACEIEEWNLDVVSAFMRAAYGKGYCDALTEEEPGSLCHDHGYKIPPRRETSVRES